MSSSLQNAFNWGTLEQTRFRFSRHFGLNRFSCMGFGFWEPQEPWGWQKAGVPWSPPSKYTSWLHCAKTDISFANVWFWGCLTCTSYTPVVEVIPLFEHREAGCGTRDASACSISKGNYLPSVHPSIHPSWSQSQLTSGGEAGYTLVLTLEWNNLSHLWPISSSQIDLRLKF